MRNIVQLPYLQNAARYVAHEAGYPLDLPVVAYKTAGAARVIPHGNSYGIGVTQDTTVEDINNLEPEISRLADNVSNYLSL